MTMEVAGQDDEEEETDPYEPVSEEDWGVTAVRTVIAGFGGAAWVLVEEFGESVAAVDVDVSSHLCKEVGGMEL